MGGLRGKSIRLSRMRRALSSPAPLESVRELIPDDGTGPQQVVVYAYACLLETGAAGLSILFDRFEEEELRKVDSSLVAIAASKTLSDLRTLAQQLDDLATTGLSRIDASGALSERKGTRQIDSRAEDHVAELERQILLYCERNLESL